jgi:hypothetical protein
MVGSSRRRNGCNNRCIWLHLLSDMDLFRDKSPVRWSKKGIVEKRHAESAVHSRSHWAW